MHFLEEHILNQLRKINIPAPGDVVVVAVSGGVDSVALFHLLATIADVLEIKLCAVYVDHGLRPQETVAEAALVGEMALQFGADFRSGSVAVQEYANEQGVSIEAAARELRYEFLEKVAEELGASTIAVAHTADDQAEEVLLRLIRGTGRNGLAGMATVNYRNIIRPLLQISKEQLYDFVNEKEIAFLEDSSNSRRDYLRNRVRLDLLPYLAENFNPAIRQTLLRTADILTAEDELLDKLAGALYQKVVNEKNERGVLLVDVDILLAAHLALQRRVLERILVELGSKPSYKQIDKLLEFIAEADNGKELHLGAGLRVVRRASGLELSFPAGRNPHRASISKIAELSFVKVIAKPGNYFIDELEVNLLIEIIPQKPERHELLKTAADYLDISTIQFPLTVRSIRPGDRFHPLGGGGSKKVANFLSDNKIARESRCRVVVLENNDGQIVALPGLRIDHRCRLSGNTEKVLKIRVLSIEK